MIDPSSWEIPGNCLRNFDLDRDEVVSAKSVLGSALLDRQLVVSSGESSERLKSNMQVSCSVYCVEACNQ